MHAHDIFHEVRAAEARIRPYIRETYLQRSDHLSDVHNANIFLKLENLQFTGSFKVRGALNKVLSLTSEQRARGIVTASTGNHGAAVAFSLRKVETPGIVFVPENASPGKVQMVRRLGAEVRPHATDNAETEAYARQYARDHNMIYISPYNDPHVIAGQGTIAVELAVQLEHIDTVVVAVGGGGLISGIAGYLKARMPAVQVIGCSPENSQVMIQSVRAGRILDLPSLPSLSDGTAGGLEAGAITFELCRDLVDDYVTITEDEIQEALYSFLDSHHMLIEGAAAVPLAAMTRLSKQIRGKNVVAIICGRNISMETLATVLRNMRMG